MNAAFSTPPEAALPHCHLRARRVLRGQGEFFTAEDAAGAEYNGVMRPRREGVPCLTSSGTVRSGGRTWRWGLKGVLG